ncbi:MAG: hypothetical protein NT007_00740 [Candidatus Kapabacteria bacterium]|nr:hypothetical protein [Candidatus Kapabacteria bacterium]
MKIYLEIIPTEQGSHADQLNECLNILDKKLLDKGINQSYIIKQSVFFSDNLNENSKKLIEQLKQVISNYYDGNIPPASIISQSPATSLIALEVVALDSSSNHYSIERKNYQDIIYTIINYTSHEELWIAGIWASSGNASFTELSENCLQLLEQILLSENYSLSDIVRQWNYIQDIYSIQNDGLSDFQNYQLFNDARAKYYNKYEWKSGYPAATGIGAASGGLIIDCLAIKPKTKLEIIPLKNPSQIDAHHYSDVKMFGATNLTHSLTKEKEVGTEYNSLSEGFNKVEVIHSNYPFSTPKFERAKIIKYGEYIEILVSGTASIKGEETVFISNPQQQTLVTIDNIQKLISSENLESHGLQHLSEQRSFQMVRVYIKNSDDAKVIKEICDKEYRHIAIIYLIADVCREDLLVEIEAVLTLTSNIPANF